MARIVGLVHRKWRFDASAAGYADRFSGFDDLNESEKIAAVVQMQEWLQPQLLQLGWDVPAFWLPIRLDGYLSFNVGVYGRCSQLFSSCFEATSPALAVVHTAHYSRLFSWYIRGSWIPRKREVDDALDESDWLMGAGLALAPSKVVRLRFGLDTELRHTAPLLGESRFAVQVVVQPFQRGAPAGQSASQDQ